MTALPQNIPDSGSPVPITNENFGSLSPFFCYANNPLINDLLHRGYSGGRWGGFDVPDYDHTFGASTTTYVSAKVSDGTLDFSTSNTNFNDATNYKRVETVVTSSTAITTVADYRAGPGGAHGSGGGTGGGGLTDGDYGDIVVSGSGTVLTVDSPVIQTIRTVPQNSKSAAYTTVLADGGKHLLHPSADTTARVFTIDSNANVAYPVGTAITFVNQHSAGVITIAITSDTMRLAGAGTTGSRTLAADGTATALKITSTEWIISGTGLT